MLNKTFLMGRLAQDPVKRFTQSGLAVASFDLAVPVPSREKETPPDFFTIVCWRETANFAEKYLTKGRRITVEGKLRTRHYTAQDGSKRKVTEVVADNIYFSDSGNASGQSGAPAPDPEPPESGRFTEVDDDELPF